MKLFCFYDTIAEEYSLPFGAKNEGCAIRIYKDNVKKGMNPEEVKMFICGKFDQEKGKFTDCDEWNELDCNLRTTIYEETENETKK